MSKHIFAQDDERKTPMGERKQSDLRSIVTCIKLLKIQQENRRHELL